MTDSTPLGVTCVLAHHSDCPLHQHHHHPLPRPRPHPRRRGSPRSFYADELYVPQNDPAGFDSPPWPDALPRMGPKMALLGVTAGPRNLVLFISRAAGRKRSLTNEAALVAAMRATLRQDLELVHMVDPNQDMWLLSAQVAFRSQVRGGGGQCGCCGVSLSGFATPPTTQPASLCTPFCNSSLAALAVGWDGAHCVAVVKGCVHAQPCVRLCATFYPHAFEHWR